MIAGTPTLDPQEARIAGAVIKAALQRGYRISIHDGEDFTLIRSSDEEAITEALGLTEEESLTVRDASGSKIGTMLFVWGAGEDCICDHTDNPEMIALAAAGAAAA